MVGFNICSIVDVGRIQKFKKGDLVTYSLLKNIDLEMLPHLKTDEVSNVIFLYSKYEAGFISLL